MPILRSAVSLLLVLMLMSVVASAYTPLPDSPLARREHPRLHLTQENVHEIRAAISSDPDLRSWYQEYVDWAVTADTSDKHNGIGECRHSIFRAYMLDFALIAAIGQVSGISYPRSLDWYADRAISELSSNSGSGDLGFVGALVYDWTYNYMTSSERSSIANKLSQRTLCHKVFSVTMRSPQITPTQMFSSKYLEGLYAYYIGLALWGDGHVDSYADTAVETFYDDFLNYGYLDAQSFSGEGGGWSEWIGYSSWHPSRHMLNVDAWRTATGEDYISGDGIRVEPEFPSTQIRDYAKFLHYAIDPHRYLPEPGSPLSFDEFTFVRTGGASTTDTRLAHSEKKRELRFLPGLYMDSGLSTEAGLARDFLERYEVPVSSYPFYHSWIFLGARGYPDSISPVESGLPKSHWARNHGTFFARTGFTSEDDTVFTVNDGHFRYNGHSGPNRWPGFSLNKFGPLANTRYVAHRGYGNLDDYPGAFRDNVIDFGVEEKYVELRDPPDLEAAIKGQGDYDHGGIEQVTVLEDRLYHVRSDRSKTYDGGISHTREYVWLPGQDPSTDQDFLVIYDRTSSSGEPGWTYHVPWEPTAYGHSSSSSIATGSGETDRTGTRYTGRGIAIRELNGLGDEDDLEHDGKVYDYVGGNQAHGVLFSKTLLPEQADVEVTRVAKVDESVLDRQGPLAIKSHRWQVQTRPTASGTEHRFLHVMETGEETLHTSMTPTSLVRTSSFEGAWIQRPDSSRPNHLVLFRKDKGVHAGSLSYTVSGTGAVRHVISGLRPDVQYDVHDSGTGQSFQVSPASDPELWQYRDGTVNQEVGLLYFETSLSSSSTITLTPTGSPPSDTQPPYRSGPDPTGTLPSGTTQTTISLSTDEASTCRYSSSPGVAYGSMQNTFSSTGSTSHSTLVTGLQDGKGYSFYVRCSDSHGNENQDDLLISFSIGEQQEECQEVCKLNPCSSYEDCSPSSGSCISGNCCSGSCVEPGNAYYVSPDGSDTENPGTLSQPFRTIGKGLSLAQPGEAVIVRGGTYNEKVSFPRSGSQGSRITLKAYGSEEVTVEQTGRAMDVGQPHITVEGITFDGRWGQSDLIDVGSGADFLILRDCEFRNTMKDAIDMGSPEGVLIEGCRIHDAIWFDGGQRNDAHGIVTSGVKDMVISGTEIYYVSGDAVQLQYGGWDNVLIEDSVLWNGPLPSARGGAPSGMNPCEDGVDTKFYPGDGRGRLTIRNVTAFGWDGDFTSNSAAFNLKDSVEVELDGVTAYGNEIGFRLRGPGSNGGAWVTLKNAVIYDSEKGVRYEDGIENLRIFNSVFGDGLTYQFQSAGGHGPGFEVKNCLFVGSTPPEASHYSNLAAGSQDFLDLSSDNYKITSDSPARDEGVTIAEVTQDRDGKPRPWGDAYDVGAYEYRSGHRADQPPQDGCLTMDELMVWIGKWKGDSTRYPMWELMEAVSLWRSGEGCS